MEIRVQYDSAGPQALAFAAAELKDYLERMLAEEAGVWPAVLTVRPGDLPEPDRFSVRLTPEAGHITGNSGRAVLLGVYDLLRRLGCRFLAPGRENEIVPAISREELALDYERQASFRHRGVCIEGADSRENVLNFIDWLPKAGYNSFFLQFKVPYTFFVRWYHHEKNPLRQPEPYGLEDAVSDMEDAERELRRRGLLLHKVGHGWTGEVLGYETASWETARPLVEEKRPFAAMVNGRRELYLGIPANTNLCLSNPDAAKQFENLVVEYAKNNPNVDYLHIWLADEYNNVCECEQCRQTTVSDQYIALLNEIDRRLRLEGLDTRLVFLLYQELLWPPVKERLQNPERFVLMFAPISRTFSESYRLGEETELPFPAYVRNRIMLPVDLGENLAFLRGWQKQFTGDSFVYDYPLGRAHYGDFGYIHISRVIHEDVRKLDRLGLNGYISCQELRAGLPNTLPNYVMGRVRLDRAAGFEEIVDEYFSAAYGPGWELARECLRLLSDLQVCDYLNGKGARQNAQTAERLERVVACCTRFRAELNRRVPGDDPVREGFWARLGYHLEYVTLLARAMGCLARGENTQGGEAWAFMREFICRGEERFQPWLDVYRVLEVTEKYTGLGPPGQGSA